MTGRARRTAAVAALAALGLVTAVPAAAAPRAERGTGGGSHEAAAAHRTEHRPAPASSRRPAHAGRPGRPDHAGQPGPPPHAQGRGDDQRGTPPRGGDATPDHAGPPPHAGQPGPPPHAGQPGPPPHAGSEDGRPRPGASSPEPRPADPPGAGAGPEASDPADGGTTTPGRTDRRTRGQGSAAADLDRRTAATPRASVILLPVATSTTAGATAEPAVRGPLGWSGRAPTVDRRATAGSTQGAAAAHIGVGELLAGTGMLLAFAPADPVRHLAVPGGLVLLLGVYLAGHRRLDRGRLPWRAPIGADPEGADGRIVL